MAAVYMAIFIVPLILKPELIVSAAAALMKLLPSYLAYVANRCSNQVVLEVERAFVEVANEVTPMQVNTSSSSVGPGLFLASAAWLVGRVAGAVPAAAVPAGR